MDTVKFKILEVIVRNRGMLFDNMRVELMREFPEMSWEEICSFVALLSQEEYIKTLYGDNELKGILVQPTAFARLYDAKERARSETVKEIIDSILKVARILPLL